MLSVNPNPNGSDFEKCQSLRRDRYSELLSMQIILFQVMARKGKRAAVDPDPFKTPVTKPQGQKRGTSKQIASQPAAIAAPAPAISTLSTAEFRNKYFVQTIAVTNKAFQQVNGNYEHFNVRSLNETRVAKLRYACVCSHCANICTIYQYL